MEVRIQVKISEWRWSYVFAVKLQWKSGYKSRYQGTRHIFCETAMEVKIQVKILKSRCSYIFAKLQWKSRYWNQDDCIFLRNCNGSQDTSQDIRVKMMWNCNGSQDTSQDIKIKIIVNPSQDIRVKMSIYILLLQRWYLLTLLFLVLLTVMSVVLHTWNMEFS